MVGFCEDGNEFSDLTKTEYSDQMSNCHLFKEDPVPWSYFLKPVRCNPAESCSTFNTC